MSNNIATLNPYDIFIGLDGRPLSGGYIYVGVAGQDPELAPVSIFWDTAGTIPAPQPLRTLNGYLSNGGSPARIALSGSYSVRVRDKKGQQVYFEPNALITSVGTGISLIADSGGFIAKLLTSAGEIGYGIYNQAGARILELLGLGSTAPPLYGIQPGMAGLNTPAGVDLTLGTGDAVKMTLKDSLGLIGIGKVPAAGKGLVQLQGSATGGLGLGNIDNADPDVFDFYKEGSWTPALRIGGLFGATTYSAAAGRWQRIGNTVFFTGLLQINVYDGSVGGLTFSQTVPIPYAALAGTFPVLVQMQGMNIASPGWYAQGTIGGGGVPDISLRMLSTAGSAVAVAGTNIVLVNGGSIAVSGFFPVA